MRKPPGWAAGGNLARMVKFVRYRGDESVYSDCDDEIATLIARSALALGLPVDFKVGLLSIDVDDDQAISLAGGAPTHAG